MCSSDLRSASGFFASALSLGSVAVEEERVRDEARELMSYLKLDAYAQRAAGDLPFGIQKRVELARALAAKPKLLLLDEPAAGLNHDELSGLSDLICDIRDRMGITVLLVEHHMGLVMGISDHIVALNFGRKIAEGTPTEIQNHPDVIAAYLGAPRDAKAA